MDLKGDVEASHVSSRQDQVCISTQPSDNLATRRGRYMIADFKPPFIIRFIGGGGRDEFAIVGMLED